MNRLQMPPRNNKKTPASGSKNALGLCASRTKLVLAPRRARLYSPSECQPCAIQHSGSLFFAASTRSFRETYCSDHRVAGSRYFGYILEQFVRSSTYGRSVWKPRGVQLARHRPSGLLHHWLPSRRTLPSSVASNSRSRSSSMTRLTGCLGY
jgi:hypothetical protein